MQLFILTGLFKPTALRKSGERGLYELGFLRIPWNISNLKDDIFDLLIFDHMERSCLDPESMIDYGKWRDELEKIGIGIQAWKVTTDQHSLKKIRLLDQMCHFPIPSQKSLFPYSQYPEFPEWGWKLLPQSQQIALQACSTAAEKLHYKPLEFLVPEIQPHISYTWPSENPRDPKGIEELEPLLLNLVEK